MPKNHKHSAAQKMVALIRNQGLVGTAGFTVDELLALGKDNLPLKMALQDEKLWRKIYKRDFPTLPLATYPGIGFMATVRLETLLKSLKAPDPLKEDIRNLFYPFIVRDTLLEYLETILSTSTRPEKLQAWIEQVQIWLKKTPHKYQLDLISTLLALTAQYNIIDLTQVLEKTSKNANITEICRQKSSLHDFLDDCLQTNHELAHLLQRHYAPTMLKSYSQLCEQKPQEISCTARERRKIATYVARLPIDYPCAQPRDSQEWAYYEDKPSQVQNLLERLVPITGTALLRQLPTESSMDSYYYLCALEHCCEALKANNTHVQAFLSEVFILKQNVSIDICTLVLNQLCLNNKTFNTDYLRQFFNCCHQAYGYYQQSGQQAFKDYLEIELDEINQPAISAFWSSRPSHVTENKIRRALSQ